MSGEHLILSPTFSVYLGENSTKIHRVLPAEFANIFVPEDTAIEVIVTAAATTAATTAAAATAYYVYEEYYGGTLGELKKEYYSKGNDAYTVELEKLHIKTACLLTRNGLLRLYELDGITLSEPYKKELIDPKDAAITQWVVMNKISTQLSNIEQTQ